MKQRVETMKERLGTTDKDFVINEIRLSEEAHAAITRRHFGINWQEPENYDLVLNTERVSVQECVEQVLALVKGPQFQETEHSRQALADLALQTRVRAALRADPRTAKVRVLVSASKGTILLSGILDMGEEEIDVTDIAGKVPGVRDVRSALKIAMPSRTKLGA
jgi:hypothetical protein